jgi:hypothetical protein
MRRLASLRQSRITVLALVLSATAAILSLMPPPLAAVVCGDGMCPANEIIYYSSPSHKEIAGICLACTGFCSGERTIYVVFVPTCCDCE